MVVRGEASLTNGNAAGDFLRHEHVRADRGMRAVLFRRTNRDVHGMVRFEEFLNLKVGILCEEDGFWLHNCLMTVV